MATYRLLDEIVESTSPNFSKSLAPLYVEKTRPVCLCRRDGVEVYIAKIEGRYIVRRMPNTGDEHSPDCDSYEPPAELSGLGEVMGSAIKENVEDGITTLKLNFSLSKAAGRAAPTPSGDEKDSVKTDGKKLTLRGVLHYLWDEAGFNRWAPGMNGKRSWFVIRKYLLQAAENKSTKGSNLADRLYIPESYSIDKKDEIAQRRLSHMRKAAMPVKGTTQMMLVIGEIKSFSDARNGKKIMFKHVPECGFMMNDDIYKRLQKRFSSELELAAINNTHIIAISTVSVSVTGLPFIEEIAIMVVDENWIPIENDFDRMLIESLISKSRRFTKGLRFNMQSKTPLASVVLSDTQPGPTAMYILPFGASEEFGTEMGTLMAESKLASWLWEAGGSELMPPIP